MGLIEARLSLEKQQTAIGIIGLGYVGLPLACLLATKYRVIGFDINLERVEELRRGVDRTREIEDPKKLSQKTLAFSTNAKDLQGCSLFIVTVPTPVDEYKRPDLDPLLSASATVGQQMEAGSVVVFESTVYPGCTETDCCEVIEVHSGLSYKKGEFHLGYSPERVNPGDRTHTIEKIRKVVSGSSPEALEFIAGIYGSIIEAGIYKAPTIATAEAAKVIENTQRDINIALINELAVLFERCGLDTQEVLAAARTKWNFLDFTPGLVGGHCIGVDPYYLTHLAAKYGLHPQVIQSGRKINDSMGAFVAEKTLKMLLKAHDHPISSLRVGVLGVTFKENVPDLRNSKVFDVVETLESYGIEVVCVDPVCHASDLMSHYGRKLVSIESLPPCDALILAVKHDVFIKTLPLPILKTKLKPHSKVLVDLKGVYDRNEAQGLGFEIWRL